MDNEVIAKKQYSYPHDVTDQVILQTKRQYDSGIIGDSNSPYNFPLSIVPKKLDASGEKKWRVVIDFRALNEKVIGDAYLLPNITDILDHLGNARYFSVFDLATGFDQVETHSDDQSKTAFSTLCGHFEYLRRPTGIKNAHATFLRLMDFVLKGMHGTQIFVCLDGNVIYSETLEEHDTNARRLFNRLREAHLKLQPDKCEFLRIEVAYLGHIIGRDGVKPNAAKIAAIRKFPQPRTVRDIWQFLGLSGYCRRFIKDYVKLAKPLSNLLKKNTKWEWGRTQRKSFQKIRRYLCNEPVLQYPNFDKTFMLTRSEPSKDEPSSTS